ncbi:CLUMA_CG010173, isoform A [Clunio marinus]|uniref:CLUMA_CG010173, isoform A n=1 Tax=Clunio marinus TaxID=568069 RepID=A0A1J1I8B9_9DIPT|nr:CLUMA_CG010173, isoform A [Clunio marinus]
MKSEDAVVYSRTIEQKIIRFIEKPENLPNYLKVFRSVSEDDNESNNKPSQSDFLASFFNSRNNLNITSLLDTLQTLLKHHINSLSLVWCEERK